MAIMFGDRKKMAAIASGKSDKTFKPEVETDSDMQVLQSLAKDAMDAMQAGSASDFARAMKAFFAQCDMLPHEEYEGE